MTNYVYKIKLNLISWFCTLFDFEVMKDGNQVYIYKTIELEYDLYN